MKCLVITLQSKFPMETNNKKSVPSNISAWMLIFLIKMPTAVRPCTVASGSLVVDATDGVALASLQAGSQRSVHLLLHLSVAPLHSTQVASAGVIPLNLHTRDTHTHTPLKYTHTHTFNSLYFPQELFSHGKR